MADFAIIENGIVTNVIIAEDLAIAELVTKQTCIQFNRDKNYAGIGFTYDATRDAFIAPKPFNSWVLDEATCRWQAPTPYPTDGEIYTWSEDDLSWREITND